MSIPRSASPVRKTDNREPVKPTSWPDEFRQFMNSPAVNTTHIKARLKRDPMFAAWFRQQSRADYEGQQATRDIDPEVPVEVSEQRPWRIVMGRFTFLGAVRKPVGYGVFLPRLKAYIAVDGIHRAAREIVAVQDAAAAMRLSVEDADTLARSLKTEGIEAIVRI